MKAFTFLSFVVALLGHSGVQIYSPYIKKKALGSVKRKVPLFSVVCKDSSSRRCKYWTQCTKKSILSSCESLRKIYYKKRKSKIKYRVLSFIRRKMCNGRHGLSCRLLGMQYHLGYGVKRDPSKALKYYTQSCNLKEKSGCTFAGVMHHRGKLIPKNLKKGLLFYRRGCNLSCPLSCYYSGQIYHIKKYCKAANKLYKKACKFGFQQACKTSCRK